MPQISSPAAQPRNPEIVVRDRRFGRGGSLDRWWHGGDPVASAVFNALSATFPLGEAFFIESVRPFRDRAEAKLAQEIRAFSAQEVVHSREHLAFNRRATEAGYDLEPLEAAVRRELAAAKDRPAIVNLAATMALEHFTAIFAHALLADPRHLAGADPETARLWRWHAIEEIEHKAVAYDTWLAATRPWPRYARWKLKSLVMLRVTRDFVRNRAAGAMELLKQDGITGFSALLRLLYFTWVRPGMLRQVAGAWASYFLPGFHPWRSNDRHLLTMEMAGVDGPYHRQDDRHR